MPENPKDSAWPGRDNRPGEGEVQGEGDYVAGRRFQEAERSFAAKGPVEEKAHEAAEALDGPDAEALEAARRETAAGEIHPHAAGGSRSDAKLDERLDDTFPASDPPSASPGAD